MIVRRVCFSDVAFPVSLFLKETVDVDLHDRSRHDESPEPHCLPGQEPRWAEGILDPRRKRVGAFRWGGLQHPA